MSRILTILFFILTSIAHSAETLPKLKDGEPLPNDLFIKLAKMINPAVVNISTTYLPKNMPRQQPRLGPRDPFFELFEQFMGPMGPVQQRPAESLGTGFIIREDGLVITNNHVIANADVIKVQINEKSKNLIDAKVIGRDSVTDIALLKLEAKQKLPTVKLGTSSDVEVGEWVAAFGNPFGHGHTMTKGIVSALGREIDEINLAPFIQTDASINPGNSGGPLVNTQGYVIGVNTAIDPRAQGIGFAIPIDYVKSILPELEKDGSVKRGFLGIQMGELNEETAGYLGLKSTNGALVLQVVPGSPAAKAGFREYDVLTELDGSKVDSWRDVKKLVARSTVGKTIGAKVLRNGKTVALKVRLGDQPASQRAEGEPTKRYDGQKAPFNLGFRVTDYNPQLGEEFGIPPLRQAGPVVIDVEPGSRAAQSGLAPGDVILDVNRTRVFKAKTLLKVLTSDRNILRVLKGNRVVLLELSAK